MQPTRMLKVFTSPQAKVVLNKHALRLLTQTTRTSLFILETNRGLILHTEALRDNVGGNLLCIVS